jgi:2-amino-4-hydroxy-6-hydroxymethyldihydropteridine diphosphokinase
MTVLTRAYVALGSNLGDRMANLAAALDALRAVPGMAVVAVSSVYETEPWGGVEQPRYANAVVALDVAGDAPALLRVCKAIERAGGRVAGERFGPRTIDLDVVLFGEETIGSSELTVPHPRMLERDFVVTPLLEIAPNATLPGGGTIDPGLAVEGRITGIIGRLDGPGDRPEGG